GGGGGMGNVWSSSGEMRRAAARQGMPGWQRDAINSMADMVEGLGELMQPVMQSMHELWNDFKKWLEKNRDNIILGFILLGILALLYALWRLFREAKAAIWLRTRYDYFTLVWLRMIDGDGHGVQKCYEAMVRLFELQEIEKGRNENTREYLAEIMAYFRQLSIETGEMTRHYEDARYGRGANAMQAERMRELYQRIYRHLEEHY
ncbi:MAG: DUF4129 domain-containing protein, partial [Gallionellaceae bacterium]|nr:DUF4129 domain-containing protein [Gallionellaceae bacterium]